MIQGRSIPFETSSRKIDLSGPTLFQILNKEIKLKDTVGALQ